MADFELTPDVALIGQPIKIGEAVLHSLQPDNIVSVAPLKGQGKAVNDALLGAIKLGLPEVGAVNINKNTRVMWTGQGQWFVTGKTDADTLAKALSGKAAVTDQSDGWQVLTLTGADALDVMSRLCPLDFGAMTLGQTARTEFAHMMAAITPMKDGFEIMIMRSFAKTAVHEAREAMERVAAQRAMSGKG